jgi:hypothetical protein
MDGFANVALCTSWLLLQLIIFYFTNFLSTKKQRWWLIHSYSDRWFPGKFTWVCEISCFLIYLNLGFLCWKLWNLCHSICYTLLEDIHSIVSIWAVLVLAFSSCELTVFSLAIEIFPLEISGNWICPYL